MRPFRLFTLLGLILLWEVPSLQSAEQLTGSSPQTKPALDAPAAKPKESGCGRFGTQVEFVDSPSEAARKARQEQKLVFVLHVSGHFEDPRFT